MARLLSNDKPAVVITFDRGVSPARQFIIQMTNCAVDHGAINRGQNYVTLDTTFQAIANATASAVAHNRV